MCWLLGTSVLKIDDFALDFVIFLRAVAFTDEGMQEHFVRVSRHSVFLRI